MDKKQIEGLKKAVELVEKELAKDKHTIPEKRFSLRLRINKIKEELKILEEENV